MRILERMLKKYERVVEFYTEAKNPEQVELAKKEFQECLRVAKEVNELFSIHIKETENELGGLETDKIQKRVNIIKTRYFLPYSDMPKISTTQESSISPCWNGLLRRSSRNRPKSRSCARKRRSVRTLLLKPLLVPA